MNKSDLIEALSKYTELPLKKAEEVVNIVFDGMANIKPILDARIKLLKADADFKKGKNLRCSYRNDEFYKPIFIDES